MAREAKVKKVESLDVNEFKGSKEIFEHAGAIVFGFDISARSKTVELVIDNFFTEDINKEDVYLAIHDGNPSNAMPVCALPNLKALSRYIVEVPVADYITVNFTYDKVHFSIVNLPEDVEKKIFNLSYNGWYVAKNAETKLEKPEDEKKTDDKQKAEDEKKEDASDKKKTESKKTENAASKSVARTNKILAIVGGIALAFIVVVVLSLIFN